MVCNYQDYGLMRYYASYHEDGVTKFFRKLPTECDGIVFEVTLILILLSESQMSVVL
jgi:hypothetical protein